jgi:hypothetical protein
VKTRVRLGVAVAAVALLSGAALPQLGDASGYHGVVLGSKYWLRRVDGGQGIGWGTPRPKTLFNGGASASGYIFKIRWTTWGGKVAIGYGLNPIPNPKEGYYMPGVKIELKAVHIGRCYKNGQRAYRLLVVREPSRPGGRMGAWHTWSGQKTLCRWQ